jgi:hypothetical protein
LKQRGLEYNEKDDRLELAKILRADITSETKNKIEGNKNIEITNFS